MCGLAVAVGPLPSAAAVQVYNWKPPVHTRKPGDPEVQAAEPSRALLHVYCSLYCWSERASVHHGCCLPTNRAPVTWKGMVMWLRASFLYVGVRVEIRASFLAVAAAVEGACRGAGGLVGSRPALPSVALLCLPLPFLLLRYVCKFQSFRRGSWANVYSSAAQSDAPVTAL